MRTCRARAVVGMLFQSWRQHAEIIAILNIFHFLLKNIQAIQMLFQRVLFVDLIENHHVDLCS